MLFKSITFPLVWKSSIVLFQRKTGGGNRENFGGDLKIFWIEIDLYCLPGIRYSGNVKFSGIHLSSVYLRATF